LVKGKERIGLRFVVLSIDSNSGVSSLKEEEFKERKKEKRKRLKSSEHEGRKVIEKG